MVMSEKESLEIYEEARKAIEPPFLTAETAAEYKAAADPLWDEHLKRTGQQVITTPAAEPEPSDVDAKPAPKARAKKAAAEPSDDE